MRWVHFRKDINFHTQPRGQMGSRLLVQRPVGVGSLNTPAILPGEKSLEHVSRCSLVQEATQSCESSLLGTGLTP